ncbi:MAG: alpha-amylase [Proteobacteria bacterium]|nr:alpha-amylase [Pseudomonadota bacterium]
MLIYSLFPRLAGTLDQWTEHTARAAALGFDWVYLNPVQYPGFSGSLYAIKDLERLNPEFLPAGSAETLDALAEVIAAIQAQGLRVMYDLVINHTAKDSPLVATHPRWFRFDGQGHVLSPSAVDPDDARKVTVWGDLAEVDNAGSAERRTLWAFWTHLIQTYLDLGFDGFRCDAAYKVPARLWQQLIGSARQRRPDVVFAAETLGCRPSEVQALAPAGFDYLFNSSKWWNFDQPWCLDQHEQYGRVAPSIAFPESHDTARLMAESGGSAAVQRQRYAFAAAFSAGLMMPIGYEFGFSKRLHVVATRPSDWEQGGVDLQAFVAAINRIKRAVPVLGLEGHWQPQTSFDRPTLALRKNAAQCAPCWLLINKDWHEAQHFDVGELRGVPVGATLLRPSLAPAHGEAWPASGSVRLEPAEVAFLVDRPPVPIA